MADRVLVDLSPYLLRGLSAPLVAVVALSRRFGADSFPFDESGFRSATFRKLFLARAEQLSVLGLILVELDRSGRLDELHSAPSPAARHLSQLRRQAAMWDLERDLLLRRLAHAGIPALLLKGTALRLTTYRDSAERAMADLDMLVPKPSLEAAVAVLAESGYERESPERVRLYLEHFHHLIMRKPDGFVVEIHWALAPARSSFPLDPAAFWRDACEVTGNGAVRVSVPSAVHMVLHLAQQNLEDGFSQLRRLVDVDRVIAGTPDFAWARLSADAKLMRVQAVVALTLQLARVLLGTPVPPGFIDELGLSTTTRTHLALLDPVAIMLEQRGHRAVVQDLLLLWCLPDLRARVRTLTMMGTGARERLWRELGWSRATAPAAIASLLKLVGYQLMLYLAAPFGIRAEARRGKRFWREGTS